MTNTDTVTIRLHRKDNVVVALNGLKKGDRVRVEEITAAQEIPPGHKLATASIAAGETVIKYGQVIGTAVSDIEPGDHVHTHNLSAGEPAHQAAVGADARPTRRREAEALTFDAFQRPDGSVATRNFIGVISTVNCSASVSRMIANEFPPASLSDFPNVDGVVPICHGWGCGMAAAGEGFEALRDCITGYGSHPNFAGLVMIGLGCEVMQLEALGTFRDLRDSGMLKLMNVQEEGGTGASVEAGVAHVRKMLPVADQASRQPTPVDRLVVGLECGGSDAYSGISANPALGAAADLLVQQGGTVILGETPEIYGAEHLLTRRAVSPEVAGKLVERIRWWERYTARHGGEMDNNPTPGNKAGGLTTIFEKSLGAVAKAGSTDLIDVYRYAQPVTAKGLVFMDTPGYDPVSLTGMVAGGANLICFTTGRGSVYGCRPVPSLKLATHTPMYERLEADMDIDCGAILNGGTTVAEMGRRIFETILSTASGQRTKSEMLGIGNDEFVPWQIGAVM